MLSVSVITSSIGRKELAEAIRSVEAQTYTNIRHYIYINGRKWHEDARNVEASFPASPKRHFIYLPEETGDCGIGPGAGCVLAAAPWFTSSDVICYLNDDDFYDPNHVESVVAPFKQPGIEWVYALRRFVNPNGSVLCDDDFDSLGAWPCVYASPDRPQWVNHLVDNSCFAVKKKYARMCGPSWLTAGMGDRAFLAALMAQKVGFACTGEVTVNYRIGSGTGTLDMSYYEKNTKAVTANYPNGFPWRQHHIFRFVDNSIKDQQHENSSGNTGLWRPSNDPVRTGTP